MKNTILFDLDGTLLRMGQNEFLEGYISRISKVFIRLGYDPKAAVDALWAGTKAMVLNDGNMLNKERFWNKFAKILNLSQEQITEAEKACDSFYQNEFDEVKSIINHSDVPARLVKETKEKGYKVVLATNPFFPLCAVETRLSWIGLKVSDFAHVTHYGNSTYCKPNPEYFKEVLNIIDCKPEECYMIGNNPSEDMVACSLGIEGFLVNEYAEGEYDRETKEFKHGTLKDLETFIEGL